MPKASPWAYGLLGEKMIDKEPCVHFENIGKSFGEVKANHNVNLSIYPGEVLALLGENGSGKTTLMNMLCGLYHQDEGSIYINGELANISSPKDAFSYKIGMIHQHFKLIEVFTSLENILLGLKPINKVEEKSKEFFKDSYRYIKNLINKTFKKNVVSENKEVKTSKKEQKAIVEDKANAKVARKLVEQICSKYGFSVDLDKKVYDMSVSEKQTLEIIKAVYRGADILILDEPTAVLTPLETERLFAILKNMKEDGKSIIIITHKLNEVLAVSDRVAVLRKGECIGVVQTKDTNEHELTEMMVGEKVDLKIKRSKPVDPKERLIVDGLSVKNVEGREVLHNVSFTARSGEILGIAGISGSGQKELLEAIAGLAKENEGSLIYIPPEGDAINLRNKNAMQIRNLGVRLAFVPEDRLGMGLVGNMDLVDNMMLRSYRKGKSAFLDRKAPTLLAEEVVNELHVNTPSIHTSVRKLSGGNVQKVLVGREIASVPKVLMVAYPTRGLDINSSYVIYNLLNDEKKKGTAIIYVGEDLDVLLALSDRIAVLSDGHLSEELDARKTTKKEIGLLMTKNYEKEEKKDEQVTQ